VFTSYNGTDYGHLDYKVIRESSEADPGGQSCHGPPPSSFAMDFGPPPAKENKIFSPNFPNFCDYFVKKVVSEIRKCR